MGGSTSRHGSSSSEPRFNRRNRRISFFICGSSSSQPQIEIEDNPSESLISSMEILAPVVVETRSSAADSSLTFASETGFINSTTENVASSSSSDATTEDTKLSSNHTNSSCSCAESSTQSGSVNNKVAEDVSNSHSNGESNESHRDSPSRSVAVVSDSLVTFQLLGDDSAQEAIAPSSELIGQDPLSGSVLHVDVVSISANILSSSISEISNREARRNSRRLFWDAFSRRSLRRHNDSPTIVFTTGHSDDGGSHDRWLLDFSGDLHYDGVGRDSGYFATRSDRSSERRRQSRSELSERLHNDLDDEGFPFSPCVSGLHPSGTCSCESFFMAEESSARASISRVVMLAEALFEVLDEIRRQPVPLSLSMLSLPAPASVVNSFPLKNHKKSNATENGVQDVHQCYICLAEYEEEDKIRVLPCRHEFHMSCVDKWLKEIHGVCPLCRGDVCDRGSEGSVPDAEISFL